MNKPSRGKPKPEGRDPESGRIYVESVDDIPCFASDEEEVEFWETHEPTMKLFNPRGMSLEDALRQAKARKHPAER